MAIMIGAIVLSLILIVFLIGLIEEL